MASEKGWDLIWQDEFEENKLDLSKWNIIKRNKADWGNYMSDKKELIRIENGKLHLRGIVNENRMKDTVPFLTGGIDSKGKFAFQYGKIEIRAKLEQAQGAWPALWMLANEPKYGEYPRNGEIDLMEHLNYENKIYQTIHSYYTLELKQDKIPPRFAMPKVSAPEFNTYGMEWFPDKLVFTLNGEKTFTYPKLVNVDSTQWPFDQPFYLMMDMQLGGNWVGKVNPEDLPVQMIIDWVKVYGQKINQVEQWDTHEISLTATEIYENPYTDVEVWGLFFNQNGDTLKRPAFWDGGTRWKLRFAPPDADGQWHWQSFSSNQDDIGLHNQKGGFSSILNASSNTLIQNGLLKMSSGYRNVVQRSGKSFLMVADTPWAIPFRATSEQVEIYAKDRQEKGYNTALMMTLQPDTKAKGPNERNKEEGFKRAFEDLSAGHINHINVDYFQYYDSLVKTLLNHEIVPVFQPVFHGYGWKGLEVLGRNIEPKEYVRYCKYLLARYGSAPAFWLLGGDHNGKDPGILESGEMMEEWDCYAQPTGIHYNPCDDFLASWAEGNREHCFHYNKAFQDAPWLDFQWAQTGHDSKHLYHKVERMYENLPVKAVANGEPTYEGMNDGKNGLGWWQGEEAWMQLMHGGTMGVVYGAATLWQWKVSKTEEGWPAWTDQPTSWKEAMAMEGSKYVGLVGQILGRLDMADIEKRWDLANGKPLLAKEGALYISYLNKGGEITIQELPANLNYSWVNPKTGEPKQIGKVIGDTFKAPSENPWVLIIKP